MSDSQNSKKYGPSWLIYTSLVIVGILLLADAVQMLTLTRWTAKVGIGLIWSAIALLTGKGRWAGNLAVIIIWAGIIATYLF
ncbi:MAG TPA: hypothetical protein PLF13_05810 [candidate division Zixibacteria bacterium]|nr:hypothetical protein [candidate division Zixibacteria bacterium]